MNHHDQIEFLREHNAHQITHSLGRLLTHLEGTYSLLREWGNDEDTCAAGLFHSVYGTLNFRSVMITDREKLRVVIGEKAEQLVWLLSIIDANEVEIDEDTTRRLVEIQVADLFGTLSDD